MDIILLVKETTITVEKKALVIVVPYLGSISLQTMTKLKKSLKTSLIAVNVVTRNGKIVWKHGPS